MVENRGMCEDIVYNNYEMTLMSYYIIFQVISEVKMNLSVPSYNFQRSSIEMRVLEHFLAHKTHESRHQITQIALNG